MITVLEEEKKKAPAAEPIKEEQTYEQYIGNIKSHIYTLGGDYTTQIVKTIDMLSAELVAKHNQGVQLIEEIARLHRILNEKNIPFEQKNLKNKGE